jgi:hypothetical protein
VPPVQLPFMAMLLSTTILMQVVSPILFTALPIFALTEIFADLGAVPGNFAIKEPLFAGSGVKVPPPSTVTVKLDTLDNRLYFPDQLIDLVKLDVQGAELDILNGGRKTIKRSKYVLIEVSLVEYNQGAPLIDEIVNKMKEYEFVIDDILEYHKTNQNQIFQMDILFRNSYIY